MNIIRAFVMGALALAVTACTPSVKSDVVRFHKLTKPAGETFILVADKAEHDGSLEFAQYANLVAAKLVAEGYSAFEGDGQADLVVKLNYGVDEGQEKVESRPNWPMAFYDFHDHFYFDRFYHQRGFNYGLYSRDVRSYTVFTRHLSVDMENVKGESLFEGRVVSVGRDRRLPEVMPYLVEAMFANFPGESGVTKVVRIRKDGEGNY